MNLVDVQKALLLKLKSLSLSVSPTEIRELQWQSTRFVYPNVRVRVESFDADKSPCTSAKVSLVIIIASEKPSSLECNVIASEIYSAINGKSFSFDSIRFLSPDCMQFGAIRNFEEEKWQAEIRMENTIVQMA